MEVMVVMAKVSKTVTEIVISIVMTECMCCVSTWVSVGVSSCMTWESEVSIVSQAVLSSVSWEAVISFMTKTMLKTVSVESKISLIESMSKAMLVTMAVSMIIVVKPMAKSMIDPMSSSTMMSGSMWKTVVKSVVIIMSIMAESVVSPAIAVVTVAMEISVIEVVLVPKVISMSEEVSVS